MEYGQKLSGLGIDTLEAILSNMAKRREQWGNDYSFALVQEIKKRGYQIDYVNYKMIYRNEEKNTE
jgi:hypothetical protein